MEDNMFMHIYAVDHCMAIRRHLNNLTSKSASTTTKKTNKSVPLVLILEETFLSSFAVQQWHLRL